jgi:hypothetical protein
MRCRTVPISGHRREDGGCDHSARCGGSTEPMRSGQGEVIADLDFALIDRRKAFMDSSAHHSRPELLSLLIDHTPSAHIHRRSPASPGIADIEESDRVIP